VPVLKISTAPSALIYENGVFHTTGHGKSLRSLELAIQPLEKLNLNVLFTRRFPFHNLNWN
jgi:hypothetical protein